MIKHTPGPWSLSNEPFEKSDNGVLQGHVTVDAPSHGALAQVVWKMADAQTSPECEANARLIAAAPDLLTKGKHLAVKLAEVYRAAGQSPKDCQAIREWMETVAKAEGRS